MKKAPTIGLRYDSEDHQLTLQGLHIKRFAPQATAVRKLLEAFEREQFPCEIHLRLRSPKMRAWLRSAVKQLQRDRKVRAYVIFSMNGRGNGACWKLNPTRPRTTPNSPTCEIPAEFD